MTHPFVCSLFALGACCGLAPVPALAQQNNATANAALISFSSPHEFYDRAVTVTLSAPAGSEIRYTLDGTTPSPTRGLGYTQPIEIKETTILRALAIGASNKSGPITTQTYIFPADVLRQSQDGRPPPHLPARWGNSRVDYGMDARIVDAPANREQMIPALKSLPSFSLVLDPADLFGAERGVYSNPEREGRTAERPASLELIYPDGRKGFQIHCGVRIRGGVSSGGWNPKHGFRLFFRNEYGAGKLKFPVFGTNAAPTFDSFDLRCAQNHSWHMENETECFFVRDQFNRDLQLALGQPAARGDFCHVYLNGQYWGLYDTCERPEASFAASYFGGHKEDYDAVKTHGVGGDQRRIFTLAATDGTDASWRRLYALAKAGLKDNTAYFRLQGRNADGSTNSQGEVLLDPANLIDYLLLIFYSGNYDAPVTKFFGNAQANNWHSIRKKNGHDGFRFFIWDAEHSLLEINENRLGPFSAGEQYRTSNPQCLWQQCLENAEFRVLVADRIQRHFFGNGALTPAATRTLFDRRIAEIDSAVLAESARWGDSHPSRPQQPGPARPPLRTPFTRDAWRAQVQHMRAVYLPKRTGIVLNHQLRAAGLVGSASPPQISVESAGTPAQKISLTTDRGEILYTTDGSDPRGRWGNRRSIRAHRARPHYDTQWRGGKSAR